MQENGAGAEFARSWLARRGVMSIDVGTWAGPDVLGGEVHTANDVAHAWTGKALNDTGLDGQGRLRLALGLLDLLDEYWVTVEIGWALQGTQDGQLARTFWDAYRQRLEATEPAEVVCYSLWVDWFEDRSTAAVAFAETLTDDVDRLQAEGRLDELAQGPLFRRAERVLQTSGPVPWLVKHRVYETVATVAELHPALYRGILASYHDVYGDLEPQSALALVRGLSLPANTKHLAALYTVLAAGGVNHYLDPDAWRAATAGSGI